MALDRASYNQGQNAQFDIGISEDGISQTVIAKGPGAVAYATVAIEGNGSRPSHKGDGYAETDKSYTLNTTEVHGVAYCTEAIEDLKMPTETCVISTSHSGAHTNFSKNICGTLAATDYKDPPTAAYANGARYIVRRLTPMECERLQGFPDFWTDIGDYTDTKGKARKCSDAVRYKALGNSIALPSWRWLLGRLCGNYDRPATMASLFDGIGGFPLIWEEINGKGTAVWASEIEDFPIAVTKERIGE